MENAKTRHARRHSVNTPNLTPNKAAHFDVRRSLDVSKYKCSQETRLVSDPKEAADVAIIFGQLVSLAQLGFPLKAALFTDTLLDESVLHLRRVWS